MCTPSTISVDNDLPSCQTSITLGAANHKCARRLEMVDRVIIEILGRDDFLQKNATLLKYYLVEVTQNYYSLLTMTFNVGKHYKRGLAPLTFHTI